MTQEVKILSIIGIATLLLLIGGVFFLSAKQPKGVTDPKGQTVYHIDYSKGEKIGTDSAKVKLVEFGDLQCPACKAYEPSVEQIRNKQKDNPNFQLIWRHFPLYPTPHKYAKIAAEAVEEANTQGKFWQLHDKIFATQDEWTALADDNKITDYFVNLATGLGIDGNKVRDAIKNNTYEDKIMADKDEGGKVGVNSTPSFYLNGKKLILNNLTDLATEVENALK